MRKNLLLVIFLLVSVAVLLSACGDTGEVKDDTVKIMVSADAGATVTSPNPIEAKIGEDVEFDIEIDKTYAFVSTSAGAYNPITGKLKIENVTERLTVKFETLSLGYDTTLTTPYSFIGGENDTSSQIPSPKVNFGTLITLNANDTKRIFVGWSLGKPVSNGGELLSTDREYVFRASPDLVYNGLITIYSNYKDSNILYYDANGGEINTASQNLKDSPYYTSEIMGERVKITLGEKYYSYSECASTFYDDGTFIRNGYVLKEYNTKADGSGEAYSIGSKFYQGGETDHSTLYCIWAEESPHSEFTYSKYSMPLPSGVKEANAAHWISEGLVITAYNGDEKEVTVPKTINGVPVIAIAGGAFTNRSISSLVLSGNIQSIEAGAFVGCSALETVYYPDSIYYISNEIFDAQTYKNFKHLYVNATMAPRFSKTSSGAFSVKLSRVLANVSKNRIIVVGGSSTLEGLSTEFLEALLDEKYVVVNFGTTRTTHCLLYLEAMGALTHEGDVVIYSPENSIYQLGEREMYWKTLRDVEGMYNIFRHVDISNYTNVFDAFADTNQQYRYTRAPSAYEEICTVTATDYLGEHHNTGRDEYCNKKRYTAGYYITLNNRFKTKLEGDFNDEELQAANKDYNDPNNLTWCSIDLPEYTSLVNHSIAAAKAGGAKVYFGFCPVDGKSVVAEAQNREWLEAYDKLIEDTYDFDGNIGSCINYIYAREYFYDNAFHTNDYGKVYRTYQLYLDLLDYMGEDMKRYELYSKGTTFAGCCFEKGSDGTPNYFLYFIEAMR